MANKQEIVVSQKGAQKTARSLGSVDKAIDGMAKSALKYATAAGVLIAANKAIELTKLAADAINVEKAFRNLAKQPDILLASMKKATGGIISEMGLMQKYNEAALLGLPLDRFDEMLSIARSTAQATGQSMDFMLNSIVTGIGRQSKLMIDNLGIMVSVEDSYEKYASALGRTAKSLSDVEKKQAFANAVLDAGAANIDKVGGASAGAFDGLNKLTTMIKDNTIDAFKNLVQPVDAVAGALADLITVSDIGMLDPEERMLKLSKDAMAFAGANRTVRDSLMARWEAEEKVRDAEILAIEAAGFKNETEDITISKIREQSEAVSGLIQLYPELGAVGASATDLQVSGLERLNLLTSTVKDSLGGMGQTWMQLAQMGGASNKTMFEIGKAASIASASINTYEAATKAYASAPPPFNFINAALVTAAGLAQVAMIKGTTMKAATGADFTTNGPQMLLVGDNRSGKERVQVTPLGGDPNLNGPQGGTTFNFYGDVIGTDQFVRDSLIPKIKNAMRLGHA